MLVYVAAALCVLFLAVSGVLVYKNSKLIANQRRAEAPVQLIARYTVLNTKKLTEEDLKASVPILQVSYEEHGESCHLVLSRMMGRTGDLKLNEAERIFEQRLRELLNGSKIATIVTLDEVELNDEEQRIIQRLKKLSAQ